MPKLLEGKFNFSDKILQLLRKLRNKIELKIMKNIREKIPKLITSDYFMVQVKNSEISEKRKKFLNYKKIGRKS